MESKDESSKAEPMASSEPTAAKPADDGAKRKGSGNRAMREGMGMLLASLRSSEPAPPPPPSQPPAPLPAGQAKEAQVSDEPQSKKPRRERNAWKPKMREPLQAKRAEPLDFIGLSKTPLRKVAELDASQGAEVVYRQPMEAPSDGDFRKRNNFVKAVLWSPGGAELLVSSDDRLARLFALGEDSRSLSEVGRVRQGDLILDQAFLPAAPSPTFALAVRQQPVHLYAGRRCAKTATYRCQNHLDELGTVHSLAFAHDGRRLVLGLRKQLRIFDTLRPGPKSLALATTG